MIRSVLIAVLLLPAIVGAEPLRVFVSVLPLQTFVQRIGGEHVEVGVMVRPGHSPATYDPTPQQIGALSQAALYVRTGVAFEDAWMDRIRSANSTMQILDMRTGIELREIEAHDDGGNHAEHGDDDHHVHQSDPHVWTDPLLVRQMAGLIRDRLSTLDTANRAVYARNHAAFVRELDDLDREIRSLLEPLRNHSFMVFHPSWGYFADRYGLRQVPIEREGKEPGARALVALIE